MAPWRVVRWQPDSLSFLPLADGAVGGGEEAKEAAATLQVLHELAGEAPEEAVPDGAVPAALPRFLRLMGMAEAEMTGALLGMEGGALRMVARVAKQRAIQVTRHWQTVGVPLESLGTERFPSAAASAARRCSTLLPGEQQAGAVRGVCEAALALYCQPRRVARGMRGAARGPDGARERAR